MGERKPFGVEEKATHGDDGIADMDVGDGVVTALVIDLVADDRVIDITHMNADLVRTAGLDLDVEQRKLGVTLTHFPDCDGTAACAGDLHPQTVVLVAADRGLDLATILLGRAVDESDVRFENQAFAKLLRQGLMHFVIFGDHDKPRSIFIKTMNDTDAAAGLSLDRLFGKVKVKRDRVCQRAGLNTCSGVDDHAGGLIDDG